MCPGIQFNCHAIPEYCDDAGVVMPDDAGAVIIDCSICAGSVGRVPAGLLPTLVHPAGAVADHFIAAAHLEDASAFAFDVFADDLRAAGAPPAFLEACARARDEERRHASAVARLAAAFGGTPKRARVAPRAGRAFREVARENAVEGCVRETLGALIALWQAEHAEDARVRTTYRSIAREEAEHAALSWAVLRWSLPRLDDAARAELDREARRAIDAVDDAAPIDPALVRTAGLPEPAVLRAFASVLREELWSVFDAA